MVIKVLRPQDWLVERFHTQPRSHHGRRNFPPKVVPNRKQQRKAPKPDESKIKAPSEANKSRQRGVTDPARVDVARGGIVMGQVRLLRRGESLNSVDPKIAGATPQLPIRGSVNDLAVSGTARTESDSSEVIPKQIPRISAPPADFYAGSACYLSPSPRALPLPSFFSKAGVAKHLICSNSIEN